MKREFSLKTEKLLQKMDQIALRQEFVFDRIKVRKLVKEVYELLDLEQPEIVWCEDISDKGFNDAARAVWAARVAGAASASRAVWAVWDASAARAVWDASAARAVWDASAASASRAVWAVWDASAARAARVAGAASASRAVWAARVAGAVWAAGIDYDFDYFIYEHEYLQDHKGNENDRKALKAYQYFLKLKEAGVGCWAEQDGKLYIVPNPIVRLEGEVGSFRYHAEDKPAIEWKGGTKLYYYYGVKVPEKVILHPELLTKKDWSNESNLEVRRVIQERMGEDFVKKIKGKVIHKGKRGTLYEIDLKGDPEKVAHYVRVKDSSTKREYFLRTPPTIMNADASIAWTFGVDEETYNPSQEA